MQVRIYGGQGAFAVSVSYFQGIFKKQSNKNSY